MPTQTTKKVQRDAVMEQLYNALMGEIESDLTTDMIPELGEIYEGETQDEARARAEHYAWAFQTFLELWEEFIGNCKNYLEQAKTEVLQSFKEQSAKIDAHSLQTLEEKLRNA